MDNTLLPALPVHWLIIRTAVVYAVIYIALRLAGKRQVSQMGAAELIVLLLLSETVQNSIVGGDESLIGGLIAAVTLVAMSVALEYIGYRFRGAEDAIEGTPTVVIHRGKLCRNQLRREWLSRHELRSMLRKQGVQSPAEVDLAVLESDGSLSIIKKAKSDDENAGDQSDKKL